MGKADYSQLELFNPPDEHGQVKVRRANPILSYIWNYEKAVMIIIGFIIVGIIAFCLGVEKGKKNQVLSAAQDFNVEILAARQQPQALPAQALRPQALPGQGTLPADAKVVLKTPNLVAKTTGSFAIQVASFKTKSNAQQEIASLKKKGFSPIILNKGSYSVVCVGNFANKEAATTLLTELKKQYRDCLVIRR